MALDLGTKQQRTCVAGLKKNDAVAAPARCLQANVAQTLWQLRQRDRVQRWHH